ncbi:MAG TPA: lipoate--protein ligase family protein [Candidatus Binatia bacterium]|nr:lipoate--protein ligase family protein [Candidatus Binatia bacterium]
MKYLDLTFADPAANLACDEALLELCESNDEDGLLRLWEPAQYFVVVGYSNRVASEVNVSACEAKDIPILRRFSGGGAVLQGPGCLNYALAVRHERLEVPADLTAAYRFVLGRHLKYLTGRSSKTIQIQGISDLVLDGRKFSGNAQHRKRLCSLFHGTFLLDFDLRLIERCLQMPSRQPAYRQGRSHKAFLCNLGVSAETIRWALKQGWGAEATFDAIPFDRINTLLRERYSRSKWNFKY